MLDPSSSNTDLPAIPGKRYFTIGEQEFPQLKPVKRRGNRRYYQRHDVLMIRQIRNLLYEQGFTIGGARQQLSGETAKDDQQQSQQIIKQLRIELEEVLHILRR